MANADQLDLNIYNNTRNAMADAFRDQLEPALDRHDLVKVGRRLEAFPGLANQFLGALVNQIVKAKLDTVKFKNVFNVFDHERIEYGEIVQQTFVNMAKLHMYSLEKAAGREFKITPPEAMSAFHAVNWQAQYPVTVSNVELSMAFRDAGGLAEMVNYIIHSLEQAANFDAYQLYKYTIIKAYNKGLIATVGVGDGTDLKQLVKSTKETFGELQFAPTSYNEAGVMNGSDPEDVYVIMDVKTNAAVDVDVLASAFNMDKVNFLGHQLVIDGFDKFDISRLSAYMADTDALEPITQAEIDAMKDVKAIVLDREWFQVYERLHQVTDTTVNNGLYTNYWLHDWKIVSHSPYHNAVAFVTDNAIKALPATITATVTEVSTDKTGNVSIGLLAEADQPGGGVLDLNPTDAAAENGIDVSDAGIYIPKGQTSADLVGTLDGSTYNGTVSSTVKVGDTVTFTKA